MVHLNSKFVVGAVIFLATANFSYISCSWAAAKEGTKDGSGGDATSSRVSKEEILTALSEAKPDLLHALDSFESNRSDFGLRPAYFEFLAPKAEELRAKLLQLKIKVKVNAPCLDGNGQPKDGSAVAGADEICISAFRLQSKLSRESYREKILTLVAHEASHLIGADEKDASAMEKLGWSRDYSETLLEFLDHSRVINFANARAKVSSPDRGSNFGLHYYLGGAWFFLSRFELFKQIPESKQARISLALSGARALVQASSLRLRSCRETFSSQRNCEAEVFQRVDSELLQQAILKKTTGSLSDEGWLRELQLLENLVKETMRLAREALEAKFDLLIDKET